LGFTAFHRGWLPLTVSSILNIKNFDNQNATHLSKQPKQEAAFSFLIFECAKIVF
jgi:hypothetical protein